MKYLIIFLVLIGFAGTAFAVPEPLPEDDFIYSDHAVTGKIISSEIIIDPREDNSAATFYDTIIYKVKVEKWHKNPLAEDIITVYGTHFPNDVIPEPNWGVAEFEIGDTVYLYIDKTDEGLKFREYGSKLLYSKDSDKTEITLSPLKQIKSGTALVDVQCSEGKVPAVRYDRMRVACVSEETQNELWSRGWATMRLAMPGDNISEALCNNYKGKWHQEYNGCRDISDLQCSLIGGKFVDDLKICENGICPERGYEICVTENKHDLTTIKIEIGQPVDNRGLVPITTTQTTHIESLDKIIVWDFKPTDYGTWGANGERTSWDTLPSENRIYFDISGKNGSDTVKLNWSPARDDSLHVNFATCEDESIEILSGAPVSLPVPNGFSSISVSNSDGGLLPVNNQYTLSFASFFKHDIDLPDNAVVLSQAHKNCLIKNGDYTTGNLNRITFKLENEN